jgi:Aspartyl protease
MLILMTLRSAAAGSLNVSVPFELSKGHILVQAYVNGKGPYLFGFDTGASGMGRSDVRLTSELALPKVGEEQNSDGIKTVATDVVQAESLQLGPVAKSNVRLLSRDYNGAKAVAPFLMGIIGRDFFADRLLTIDYPHRTLSFTKGRLMRGSPGVVAYGPSFAVPVCFRSTCYKGKVDTGSSMSLVLPKEIALARTSGPSIHVGTGRRTNSTSELYEVALNQPVTVGGVTASGMKVVYADPADDAINVGSDFLKDYVLTIDQRHHLLKISKPGK